MFPDVGPLAAALGQQNAKPTKPLFEFSFSFWDLLVDLAQRLLAGTAIALPTVLTLIAVCYGLIAVCYGLDRGWRRWAKPLTSMVHPRHPESSRRSMEARPLPIRSIALTIIALGVISLTAQFVGLRAVHGIALFTGFLVIATMLGCHAWIDNARVTYRNFNLPRTVGSAILVWLPFIVLLVPGVVATLWIDDKIDAALRMAENATAGSIETIEEQIEDTIQGSEAVPWSWWWPPDWFKEGTRIVERKVMRTVQRDVLHPAPIWIRAFFAIVYAVMRVSQLVLYSTIAFIAIRSFVFLLARAALWNRSEIEFSLP